MPVRTLRPPARRPAATSSSHRILRGSARFPFVTSTERFSELAAVISHDRFFPDRICTHILASECEAHVEWFEGNFEERNHEVSTTRKRWQISYSYDGIASVGCVLARTTPRPSPIGA